MKECFEGLESIIKCAKIKKICLNLRKFAYCWQSGPDEECIRKCSKNWERMTKCVKGRKSMLSLRKHA